MARQEESVISVAIEKDALVVGGHALITGNPTCLTSTAEAGGLIIGTKSPGPRSTHDVVLGQLSCERFLALAKSSLYWMSPLFGTSAADVPRETQFLLLSLPGGACALLLPLIDSGRFRATLRPPDRSRGEGGASLVLRIESGDDTVMADSWPSALYVCAGRDPYEVIERGIATAARLSGGARPSREKEVPPSVDLFGWCTWDAMYSRVSAAGIQEGLQTLVDGGAPPRFLIIDDGWQQTDVDPQYRLAAAQSLVSGMGHVPTSIESWQAAAVEEAAADLLAGTNNRQREELIGLREMEEELLLTPRTAAPGSAAKVHPQSDSAHQLKGSPGPAAAAGAPKSFNSLPTSPRRYWGESPLGTPRGSAADAARGAGRAGGGGSAASPARSPLGLNPLGSRSLASLTASPRVLPPGRARSRGNLHESTSMSSLGEASLAGTPTFPRPSPRLMGGPLGNPFRRETPAASLDASPLASPLRSSLASPLRGFAGAPQLPPQTAPPPTPDVLAKQLEEAAAVVVQGVPPLRVPSGPPAVSDADLLGLRQAPGAAASGAAGPAAAGLGTAAPAVDGAGGAKGAAGRVGEGLATVEEEGEVVYEAPEPTLWGRLLGLLRRAEVAALNWLRSFLDGATSDSWRMRLFSALATGPLKGSILRFYATTTDHTRRLQSVKANTKFSHPDAGPEHPLHSSHGEDGLKLVVRELKEQYGVRYIYCWHALMGFWAGVAPDSQHTAKYQPRLVYPKPTPSILEVDPSYAWVQSVLAGVGLVANPAPLHRDMHAYLKECGVDGVKVDVQGTVGLAGSVAGGAAALSGAYHESLEASVQDHFPGNHCINCMCGSSEDMYRMTHTNLARVSDDYYPHLPASWTSHIAICAYNSLFAGELVVPDWDMFHSAHPAAWLHAAARAVSGGPVYVSDRPGVHDFTVLARLVLPDGSVLRCRGHARPTRDSLFADPLRDGQSVLKLWNLNSYCGVLGLFNLQGSAWSLAHRGFHTHDPAPPDLKARVAPADVAALAHAERYAVWRDSTQELRLVGREERVPVMLESRGGWDVLTVSPVEEQAGVRVAPLGLPHMLNTGGAVLGFRPGSAAPAAHTNTSIKGGATEETKEAPRGVAFELEAKGVGSFLCYASQRPSAVVIDGAERPFQFDSASSALTFDLPGAGPMQKHVVLRFGAA
ncbi:hypothetical protein N2152v2_006372 [Parachlorella kessleri]